jgi:hypothetical protein
MSADKLLMDWQALASALIEQGIDARMGRAIRAAIERTQSSAGIGGALVELVGGVQEIIAVAHKAADTAHVPELTLLYRAAIDALQRRTAQVSTPAAAAAAAADDPSSPDKS